MQTEREIVDEWRQETIEATNAAREQELISTQEHKNYMLEIERLYQEQLGELQKQETKTRMDGIKGALGDAASLMQSENEKLFKIGKAAALANAIINGQEAAVAAWDKGMNIGGPAVAAAFAAASLAKTGMHISNIASQSMSGGGGSAGNAGGGSASGGGSRQAAPEPAQARRSVRIEVEGEGMFADMLRGSIDEIADAVFDNSRDGGTPIVVGRG